MPDQIRITGITGHGYHGLFAHEQRDGQEFVVDVELIADLSTVGATDDFADTIDYGAVAEIAHSAIVGSSFHMIEALADAILQECCQLPMVQSASVTVHKPQAPIAVPFADVSVTRSASTGLSAANRVAFGLGSNLGDRLGYLQEAISALAAADKLNLVDVSPVYETEPVGGPEQDRYLNAVAVANTDLEPLELLRLAQQLESSAERVRTERWGPRTLDVDVLAYGSAQVDLPDLVIPHPRAAQRSFVLVPWADVDPSFYLPGQGPISDLLTGLDITGVQLTELQVHAPVRRF